MKKEDIQKLCSDDSEGVNRVVRWPSDFEGEQVVLKNLATPRYSKPNLTLEIDEGVKEIPKDFLANAGCFTKVTIPASVEKIGSMAFYKSSVSDIEFASGSNLKTIGDGAFSGTAITSFEGEKVTSLGTQAFMDCTSLIEVSFPVLEEVQPLTFAGANALSNISIPQVRSIGARAFYECGFTSFVSSARLSKIGPFAFCNGNLESVDLSASCIDVIEMGAFKGNVISSLKLPEEWDIIKSQAFQDNDISSLENIVLSFEGIIAGDAFDKGAMA